MIAMAAASAMSAMRRASGAVARKFLLLPSRRPQRVPAQKLAETSHRKAEGGAQSHDVDAVYIERLVARRVASRDAHARGRDARLLGHQPAQRLIGLAVHGRRGHTYEDGA